MTACATIIAAGVNSQPSDPNGPLRESPYTNSRRRRRHPAVERERDQALAAEPHEAEKGADRHADNRGHQQPHTGDVKRQRDDAQLGGGIR
jgi:hypothetical protein